MPYRNHSANRLALWVCCCVLIRRRMSLCSAVRLSLRLWRQQRCTRYRHLSPPKLLILISFFEFGKFLSELLFWDRKEWVHSKRKFHGLADFTGRPTPFFGPPKWAVAQAKNGRYSIFFTDRSVEISIRDSYNIS